MEVLHLSHTFSLLKLFFQQLSTSAEGQHHNGSSHVGMSNHFHQFIPHNDSFRIRNGSDSSSTSYPNRFSGYEWYFTSPN